MKNINFIPVLIYILISISCKNEVIKVPAIIEETYWDKVNYNLQFNKNNS